MTRADEPIAPKTNVEGGLTKREYFAAKVFQSILSNETEFTIPDAAEFSVLAADTLIEKLNSTEPESPI